MYFLTHSLTAINPPHSSLFGEISCTTPTQPTASQRASRDSHGTYEALYRDSRHVAVGAYFWHSILLFSFPFPNFLVSFSAPAPRRARTVSTSPWKPFPLSRLFFCRTSRARKKVKEGNSAVTFDTPSVLVSGTSLSRIGPLNVCGSTA